MRASLFRISLVVVLVTQLLPSALGSDSVNPPQPLSQGAASARLEPAPPTEEAPEPNTELIVRIGNESNFSDGVFGPITYGVRGKHRFNSGWSVEAGYIRLHEPGSPALNSFLDEAQLTINLPELKIFGEPFTVGATGWQNRMIDMYTNLGGLELTYNGKVSVTGGLYAGTATRDDLMGRFLGAQVAASMPVGPIEVSIGQMGGVIRIPGDASGLGEGKYFKTALEVAKKVRIFSKVPLTFTLGVEHRYFDFGNGGPTNDPRDAFIIIFGTEVNFGELADPPPAGK